MYAMMWNENSPFEFTGLFPGQEGIGSGVGFQLGALPDPSQAKSCCPSLTTIQQGEERSPLLPFI